MLSIPGRVAAELVRRQAIVSQTTQTTHPNSAKVGQTHSFNHIGYPDCAGEVKCRELVNFDAREPEASQHDDGLMRSIGSLTDEQHAQRFAAYLDSQEINARADANGDKWEIWVVDEDQVEAAKLKFAEFQQAPDDARYADAIRTSKRFKTQQLEEALARRRSTFRTRKMPWQRGIPLTIILMSASVYVTAMTRFGDMQIPFTRAVMMSDPRATERRMQEAPPEVVLERDRMIVGSPIPKGWNAIPEIREGEVWRLFTPMFLHFDAWHLIFNMSWLLVLGGNIESFKGTRYLLCLVLFLELVAGIAELYATGPFHGGMSGVGYGLFGFVWMRSRLVPEDGFHMEPSTVFMFFAWALICLTGAAGPIANAAHFGGMAAGAFVGVLPLFTLRNPR